MSELTPLMVPEELREALAAEAANEGISLEAIAVQAVEAHLNAIKTRKFFEERARNADPEWLMKFLDREGGEPPQPGDELPPRVMFARADRGARGYTHSLPRRAHSHLQPFGQNRILAWG